MGKFDDITKHLNPKIIIQRTELPNDTARGKYTLKSSIVTSYQEFEYTVIDYMRFHNKEIYNGASLPPEMLRHKADQFLKELGGLVESAYIGISGKDGGMIKILNMLNEKYKAEMKRAYFEYVINTFIDPLSVDDIVELMAEFKSKILSYSPKSCAYVKPEAMALDYKNIIWNYMETLNNYKNIWQF